MLEDDDDNFYKVVAGKRSVLDIDSLEVETGKIVLTTALDDEDIIEYSFSAVPLEDVQSAILDAEDYIKTKLTSYDATPSQTLIRIATWLSAGYLKANESGYMTDSGQFVQEGYNMISKAEKWLKMELERQRMSGAYTYGNVEVQDDGAVFEGLS